jgi:hypothetical protein
MIGSTSIASGASVGCCLGLKAHAATSQTIATLTVQSYRNAHPERLTAAIRNTRACSASLRATKQRAYDRSMKFVLALTIVLASACGSSSSPSTDAAAGSGSDVTLTISDYLAWCTVTEQSAAYSMTKTFPKGTVVSLDAMPVSSAFVWGYWTGTDGDTSGTHDTNMMTTVTMTTDKTVLACCPDPPPASQTCP